MNRPRTIAALVAVAFLAACSGRGVQDLTSTRPATGVKFFNYSLNSPSVNFYANDAKMTGVNSTSGVESNSGTAYGSVAAGGFYSTITPGAYTITARITAVTDNGLPIASAPATFADGKGYSFYLSGLYNTTTKQSDSFIVLDDVPAIDYTQANVRYVNAIYNAGPQTLWAKNTATGDSVLVGDAVPYKGASAFKPLPIAQYDLTIRTPGSNTALITRAGVSFAAGRTYTITGRGDMTVTGTTAANRPILDNTANY